jgi:hypothetical protein
MTLSGHETSGARNRHHDDPATQPKEKEAYGGENLKINEAGERCEKGCGPSNEERNHPNPALP